MKSGEISLDQAWKLEWNFIQDIIAPSASQMNNYVQQIAVSFFMGWIIEYSWGRARSSGKETCTRRK